MPQLEAAQAAAAVADAEHAGVVQHGCLQAFLGHAQLLQQRAVGGDGEEGEKTQLHGNDKMGGRADDRTLSNKARKTKLVRAKGCRCG